MVTEELKRQRSLVTDRVSAQMVKAGTGTMCSEIHKLNSLSV